MDSFHADNLGCAIVWIGLALLKVAKSDPDEIGADKAEEIIGLMREQHPPRPPGPYSGT